MSYSRLTWVNGGPPARNATNLNHQEAGIQDASDRLGALEPKALPAGGTTGQALVKTSNSNYATGWSTISAGGGSSYVFSADNTGAADVSAALVTQATTAAAAGQPLLVPPGNYLFTSTANPPTNATIWAPSGARFFGAVDAGGIVGLGSNTTLIGLTIENTSEPNGRAVVINGDAKSVLLDECTIKAGSIGLYASSTGIENLTMRGGRVENAYFGVLTNSGANDIKGVLIEGVTFVGIPGDAIEFNHPSGTAPTCRGFRVIGCDITGIGGTGGTTNTGFGIGAAGVQDLAITGNTIRNMLREGIHVEDGSQGVTITGNTIRGIPASGTNRGGIFVYGEGTDDVTITGNTVTDIVGNGIELVYSGGADLVSTVVIADNIVRDVSSYGLALGADYGAGEAWNVSNNIVRECGDGGIGFFGNFRYAMATNNTITDCPIGIYAGQKDQLRVLRGNLIRDCTVDYNTNSRPLVLTERHALVGLTASGATLAVPLFRLGSFAEGVVALSLTDYSSRNIVAMWRVRWDGSVLSCDRESGYAFGGASDSSLSMVNGVLTVNMTGMGADVLCWGWANFNGTLIEDMAAYSGTVAGRAFPGSIVGIGQAAYDALTPVPGVLYVITGA